MKGGGFLNNVDGTINDYEIRDSFPGETADPSDPQVFIKLTVTPDGAAPVETTLRAGSGLFLSIRDSHTLINPEGSMAKLWDKSDGYNFLQSVEKAGLKDGGIDDTPADVLSFSGLLGARFHFMQVPDEGRMAARKAAGKNPMNVKDTGKEYPFTRLEVDAYYGTGTVSATAAKPIGAGKTAATAKAGNGAVKTGATSGGASLEAEANAVLRRLLDANGGSIQRSQIAMLVTKAETANPNREALRKLIWSEAFLTNTAGIEFDQAGKTQEIRLVA